MIMVKKHGVLLRPGDESFESIAVLNPAVLREGGQLLMLYRAVSPQGISSIGLCRFKGPLRLAWRESVPVLKPAGAAERMGIEDPRLVRIDGHYLLSYTAYDGMNALGSVCTSVDLGTFERYGIVVPKILFPDFATLAGTSGVLNGKYARYAHDKILKKGNRPLWVWDKDLVFFPRRINEKLCFLHRVKPDIQLAWVNQLKELDDQYWKAYLRSFGSHILLRPKFPHEVSYLGGGCPPIETRWGWLVIYHGVCDTPDGYCYNACAALLELERPEVEISRLPYPLFSPTESWEREGKVNDVCFPSGAALFGKRLYIYYGAADYCIACASVELEALCMELLKYRSR